MTESNVTDPRFARIERLDESLKRPLAEGRIDIRAAATLSWLSPAEQKRVAGWVTGGKGRTIGAVKARRLLSIKQEGGHLDNRHIAQALRPRRREAHISVPMSKLPKGLTREQAEQWLDEAIREHIRRRR
jgi:hypothetical protein